MEQEEQLVIEPIKAYKIFKVKRTNQEPYKFKLTGYGVGDFYKYLPKKNQALCSKCDELKREVPNLKCKCGFYAHKYSIDMLDTLTFSAYAIENHRDMHPEVFERFINPNLFHHIGGIVELTGKVIEHEFGYRAEFVEIKKLLSPYGDTEMSFFFGNPFKRYARRKGLDHAKWIQQGEEISLSEPELITEHYGDSEDKIEVYESLQKYYQVPIEYYKTHFRKEL